MSTTPADSEFLTDGSQKKLDLVLECVYTHTCIRDSVYTARPVYTRLYRSMMGILVCINLLRTKFRSTCECTLEY
jgi:hypothetical protein